jgi:hypothetical protein
MALKYVSCKTIYFTSTFPYQTISVLDEELNVQQLLQQIKTPQLTNFQRVFFLQNICAAKLLYI